MNPFSRADRSPIGEWWWTIDRVTLGLIGALLTIGLLLNLAAGPAAAERMGISDNLYFVYRQALFIPPAIAVLIGASMLNLVQIRRLGAGLLAASLIVLVAVLLAGPDINGARRWISLGPFLLQPSEFAKPAFLIAVAWALALGRRHPGFPGAAIAFLMLIVLLGLLVAQPDYGQTLLVAAAWASVFFISGVSWPWIAGLSGLALFGMLAAYNAAPHVASRIDRFLDPASGDTYQVDKALEAIRGGGAIGVGPGEGRIKHELPDAHTDFIFAVAGEEFGFFLCLFLMSIFAAIVIRAYLRAMNEHSAFVQYATCGLASLVGVQAFINMAVNLRLVPAKGMTLPLVSYGGSSLIATCLTLGLLIALTRKRPGGWRRRGEL